MYLLSGHLLKISAFCPRATFLCYMFSHQTSIIPLNSINRLVFGCIYRVVRTEFLCVIYKNCEIKSGNRLKERRQHVFPELCLPVTCLSSVLPQT
jgi:hypothetical protein